ncbi:hypothetical protein Tco_0809187 [Tanacetum coccineum]
MMLLDRAIPQRFSNPTNNRLRTSSNTRNQAIVQADKVNIQSRNSGNDGRNTRHSYVQEEIIEGNNVQNYTGNTQRTLQTISSGSAANVQCYNYSEIDKAGVTLIDEQNDFLIPNATRMEEIKELSVHICLMARIQPVNIDSDAGPSYNPAFLSEVQKSSNNIDVNSGIVEYDNNVQASYELEQLVRNAYKEAEKQQINANKFIEADSKARRLERDLQTQFIRDWDIIRDLEQKRDNLQLSVVELKRQIMELQKTQTILKRKMSENEDKYHDTVLDLEAKAKENENVVLKIG